MRHVIFIDRNIPLLAEVLLPAGEIHLFDGRALTREALLLHGCTALFVRSVTRVNEPLLDGTDVRFVATATAGTDHIDEQYLESKGIAFASAGGSNSNSVAEYVLFAVLHWANVRGVSLAGRRLGIVGFGNIGRKAGRYAAELLGMEVWVNDPPLRESGYIFPSEYRYAELDELCGNCEVLTNHVPLQGGRYSTENVFDGRRIGLLSEGSLFIHASRGGVVQESALVRRLESGDIAAVCDVFCNEPLVREDLARLSLLATPHIAGYSYDAKLLGARMVAESFGAWAEISPDLAPFAAETAFAPADSASRLEILRKNRRFDEDSAAFKATFALPEAERAAAFDALRRTYPVRRETLGREREGK